MSASCFSMAGKISKKTVDQQEYSELVGRSLPHVIRNEAENDHYTHVLETLDRKPDPTPAEQELAALLTVLIENFEEEHYSLRKATPVDSVIELMEANGLKQKDLIDVFGTPSIISEVLKGKRNLTTEHIRRLSARFHVTPALFI
ncbi:MAG TPA: helix-turn-helix domain-containing protein [Terriglobia bacterium]|nr:helix-turn-helix domain-containing protein [Terriglobia bacterium]